MVNKTHFSSEFAGLISTTHFHFPRKLQTKSWLMSGLNPKGSNQVKTVKIAGICDLVLVSLGDPITHCRHPRRLVTPKVWVICTRMALEGPTCGSGEKRQMCRLLLECPSVFRRTEGLWIRSLQSKDFITSLSPKTSRDMCNATDWSDSLICCILHVSPLCSAWYKSFASTQVRTLWEVNASRSKCYLHGANPSIRFRAMEN